MKRTSKYTRVPYREIDIKALGDISTLKPSLPIDEDEDKDNVREDEEGFSPVINRKTLQRNKLFLDGSSPPN